MTGYPKWKHVLSIALCLFLLLAPYASLGVAAQAPDNLKLTVSQVDSAAFPTIQAAITVADQNGLPVTGLSVANFQIAEDAARIFTFTVQPVVNPAEPVALAVALDLSGSMKDQALSNTISATLSLISQLSPADEMALIAFTDTVRTAVPLTSNKQLLADTVQSMKVKGNTALWDGMAQAIDALSHTPQGRRAVVVVTDGQDNKSKLKLEDVTTLAVSQHLPIFPIGFGAADETVLGRLATLTGGEVAMPATDQLEAQLTARFKTILDRLHLQYTVAYTSGLLADGAEHQLTVRANYQDVVAEGQGPFIAPALPFTVSLPGFTDGQPFGVAIEARFAPKFSERAAVTSVDYLLDGVKLQTASAPPFDYAWTPTAADLGKRSLVIRATDAAKQTQDCTLALEVVPAIGLSIVSPRPSETMSGTILFQTEVTALAKVESVNFVLDSKALGQVTAAPYTLEWTKSQVTPGDHTLVVTATDVHQQTASASVTFHVPPGKWDVGLPIALAVVLASLGVILPLGMRARRTRAGASPAAGPAAGAALVVEAGPGQGQRWPVGPGETRIGRQRTKNDVVLSHSEISREQAVIRGGDGGFVYTNLSPILPTYINGQPAAGSQRLADGDRIQIGPCVLRFVGPGRAPRA